jgi:hypothetical protein
MRVHFRDFLGGPGLCRRGFRKSFTLAALSLLVPFGSLLAAPATLMNYPIVNGYVSALLQMGTTIFVGGDFTRIGPRYGDAIPIDPASGNALASFAQVAGGQVNYIVPDGTGGWYISGSFTYVSGVARAGVAHLLSNYSLDSTWNPFPTGSYGIIGPMAVLNGTLYVGGSFGTIQGQIRKNLAAFNVSTGALLPWNPAGPNANYTQLAASGTSVYVLGGFTNFGSNLQNYLAAFDASSGALLPWNASTDVQPVFMKINNGNVYVGGNFTYVNGTFNRFSAELDPTTGALLPWNPGLPSAPSDITFDGNSVYFCGGFNTNTAGVTRNYIAA